MSHMDYYNVFKSELASLTESKPPISKVKMTAITRAALRAAKLHVNIVQSVESFIQECPSEYKVSGLYIMDSIIRHAKHQFKDERKEIYTDAFEPNLTLSFVHIYKCPENEKTKVERVLSIWEKQAVYDPHTIVAKLMDMSDLNHPAHTQELEYQPSIDLLTNEPLGHEDDPQNQEVTPITPENEPETQTAHQSSTSSITNDPWKLPPGKAENIFANLDALDSILTDPTVLKQLQTLQEQIAASANRIGHGSSKSSSSSPEIHSSEMRLEEEQKEEGKKIQKEVEKEIIIEEKRLALGFPSPREDQLTVCSRTLWVGHLSKLMDERDITDTFRVYGEVACAEVISSRGCAFVVMKNRKDAMTALARLKYAKFYGKSITLAWAPGKGMKKRAWKDYWEVDGEGASFIPWAKLPPDTNIEVEFGDGGCVDGSTLPPFLADQAKSKLGEKVVDTISSVDTPTNEPIEQTGADSTTNFDDSPCATNTNYLKQPIEWMHIMAPSTVAKTTATSYFAPGTDIDNRFGLNISAPSAASMPHLFAPPFLYSDSSVVIQAQQHPITEFMFDQNSQMYTTPFHQMMQPTAFAQEVQFPTQPQFQMLYPQEQEQQQSQPQQKPPDPQQQQQQHVATSSEEEIDFSTLIIPLPPDPMPNPEERSPEFQQPTSTPQTSIPLQIQVKPKSEMSQQSQYFGALSTPTSVPNTNDLWANWISGSASVVPISGTSQIDQAASTKISNADPIIPMQIQDNIAAAEGGSWVGYPIEEENGKQFTRRPKYIEKNGCDWSHPTTTNQSNIKEGHKRGSSDVDNRNDPKQVSQQGRRRKRTRFSDLFEPPAENSHQEHAHGRSELADTFQRIVNLQGKGGSNGEEGRGQITSIGSSRTKGNQVEANDFNPKQHTTSPVPVLQRVKEIEPEENTFMNSNQLNPFLSFNGFHPCTSDFNPPPNEYKGLQSGLPVPDTPRGGDGDPKNPPSLFHVLDHPQDSYGESKPSNSLSDRGRRNSFGFSNTSPGFGEKVSRKGFNQRDAPNNKTGERNGRNSKDKNGRGSGSDEFTSGQDFGYNHSYGQTTVHRRWDRGNDRWHRGRGGFNGGTDEWTQGQDEWEEGWDEGYGEWDEGHDYGEGEGWGEGDGDQNWNWGHGGFNDGRDNRRWNRGRCDFNGSQGGWNMNPGNFNVGHGGRKNSRDFDRGRNNWDVGQRGTDGKHQRWNHNNNRGEFDRGRHNRNSEQERKTRNDRSGWRSNKSENSDLNSWTEEKSYNEPKDGTVRRIHRDRFNSSDVSATAVSKNEPRDNTESDTRWSQRRIRDDEGESESNHQNSNSNTFDDEISDKVYIIEPEYEELFTRESKIISKCRDRDRERQRDRNPNQRRVTFDLNTIETRTFEKDSAWDINENDDPSENYVENTDGANEVRKVEEQFEETQQENFNHNVIIDNQKESDSADREEISVFEQQESIRENQEFELLEHLDKQEESQNQEQPQDFEGQQDFQQYQQLEDQEKYQKEKLFEQPRDHQQQQQIEGRTEVEQEEPIEQQQVFEQQKMKEVQNEREQRLEHDQEPPLPSEEEIRKDQNDFALSSCLERYQIDQLEPSQASSYSVFDNFDYPEEDDEYKMWGDDDSDRFEIDLDRIEDIYEVDDDEMSDPLVILPEANNIKQIEYSNQFFF